ncbi:MAG: hypothetical protein P8J55_06815, partial [Pseudomonadales bacterium]|nr:hypothetical protein [Pseudomonadales bacterium]
PMSLTLAVSQPPAVGVGTRLRKHDVSVPSWRSKTTGLRGEARGARRAALTLEQTSVHAQLRAPSLKD